MPNMREALLLWKQRRDQLSNMQSTLMEKWIAVKITEEDPEGTLLEKRLTFNKSLPKLPLLIPAS